MKLTLESQNPKLLALIEELARHLGVHIKKSAVKEKGAKNKKALQKQIQDLQKQLKEAPKEEKQYPRPDNERALMALEKLAEYGSFKDIKDPVDWQREIRKDKALTGRDD